MEVTPQVTQQIPGPAAAPRKTVPFGQTRVPTSLATVIILVATLAFSFLFSEVGQAFFWDRYDTRPPQERAYEAALKRVNENPDSADAHVSLGWALFQKGQYNEALAEYKKAIDIQPKHFKAQYNLGLAYAKVEKWDRAIDQFQMAIEIAPNNFQPHYDLAMAYRATNKLPDALRELDLAYRLNPGSVDIIFARGQIYEKQGERDKALAEYQGAISLDPNYAKAREAMTQLQKPAAAPEAGGTK
ncbi:MAG: tetratricopeptide repeat protein [Symbiobacteriia bacterium]